MSDLETSPEPLQYYGNDSILKLQPITDVAGLKHNLQIIVNILVP
jgi:hypothetical protein